MVIKFSEYSYMFRPIYWPSSGYTFSLKSLYNMQELNVQLDDGQ